MRMIPMRSPLFIPLHDHLPRSTPPRRGIPARGKRILPLPGRAGDGTGLAVCGWRVDASAAWWRRAQTLPLVDWGGADGGAKMSLTAKRLLRRLFVPP